MSVPRTGTPELPGTAIPTTSPAGLDRRQTEEAIEIIRGAFLEGLTRSLNLQRVRAPLFVEESTGLNDNLNGVERPVSFRTPVLPDQEIEVVQSLAKWKRAALADLDMAPGEGIVTNMLAIRPDEELGPFHSLLVDQWDWEVVIREEDRTLPYLRETVLKIYGALRDTEGLVCAQHPTIERLLPLELAFIHAQDLEDRYPDLAPRQREDQAVRELGAVFLVGVGAPLRSGVPHDGRAPDYDDWITSNGSGPGLNGDLLVWNPVWDRALELSSMGIRVSPESLLRQLQICRCPERRNLAFHRRLLDGELPFSVGGGIGQSRIFMYLLRKAHIGEVQPSVWPVTERRKCEARGIRLM